MSSDEAILGIQNAALGSTGASCISKELSHQQAWSVLLRSEQLQREAVARPIITREDKVKQIEICWRKRTRGRNPRR